MDVEILIAHGDMRDQHRDQRGIRVVLGIHSSTNKTYRENQELNFILSEDTKVSAL